ncbi:MAG: TOBE domain-containing protein, partial [Burkholderiales bacterium]|nr:TOBE domain-containing protein [Burkholderiales bacterium]
WHHAQAVDLLFKETEVALAKNLSGMISLRNRMPGTIRHIEWGQVLTRVHLELRQNEALPVWTITSVITTRSAKKLQLAEGDQIEGLVKSNEMSLLASENKGSIA